jgi:hypothetical protein
VDLEMLPKNRSICINDRKHIKIGLTKLKGPILLSSNTSTPEIIEEISKKGRTAILVVSC